MNAVNLIGNVVRTPELRYIPSGTAVTDLRVAINEFYVSNGEKRERVVWVTCVVWGKTAENVAEYLDKGSKVGVTGRLQTREWEGKDGKKNSVLEVVADRVEFLTPKRKDAAAQDRPVRDAAVADAPPPTDDDVPF